MLGISMSVSGLIMFEGEAGGAREEGKEGREY